jgi:hypothetical protein
MIRSPIRPPRLPEMSETRFARSEVAAAMNVRQDRLYEVTEATAHIADIGWSEAPRRRAVGVAPGPSGPMLRRTHVRTVH